MSQYLALDWELHQVRGVEAQFVRGKIVVGKCFVLRWPDGRRPTDDPAAAGRWLAGELDRLKLTSHQILVAIPREDAVVRLLDLPQAPDEELPDLVRLQAATKSAVPIDQLLLDFLPLPLGVEATGRSVLMATISRQQADRIKSVLAVAQRETVSIGLSSVAIVELVARAASSRRERVAGNSLAIACHDKRIEICILDGPQLLFAHSAPLAGTTPQEHDQSILAETSRSVVAAAKMVPNLKIGRVWIVGSGAERSSLNASLRERFGCDVVTLPEPFSQAPIEASSAEAVSDSGQYAVPAGILLSREAGLVAAVDFLNPRRKTVKPDRRKLQWSLAALVLVLLVGVQYLYTQREISRLEKEIDSKRAQLDEMQALIEPELPVLAAASSIDAWERRDIDWLGQLNVLGAALKENGNGYLTEAEFSTPSRGPVAGIKATGHARGRNDAENLGDTVRDRGYRLNPHAITSTDKDGVYPWNFVLDLELTESAVAAIADVSPPSTAAAASSASAADTSRAD